MVQVVGMQGPLTPSRHGERSCGRKVGQEIDTGVRRGYFSCEKIDVENLREGEKTKGCGRDRRGSSKKKKDGALPREKIAG